MNRGLPLALVLLSACAADPEETPVCSAELPMMDSLKVTIDGTRVLDALGREVLLRGVNAGGQSKLPPFLPWTDGVESLDTYCDRPLAWGHNVIRLPVTWEAIEPDKGTYDAAFLERYLALVDAFGARGIRVIVDFHQDVFARPFCGDGFPLWAILDPIDESKERVCHQWFQGYLGDDEIWAAYDHFWNNDEGLRDAFEDFWRYLAGATWGRDHVIGFEVFNEPFQGSMAPEVWAKDVLTPFYSKMATVIREVAPGAPIFFDSTGLDAVSANTHLERPEGGGLVFAPHYYDPLAITRGIWRGHLDSLAGPLGRWREKGDEWGVPVLVGEFGIKGTADGGAEYVRLNWEALDAHLLHGTQWEYSASENDWNTEGMTVYSLTDGERPTVAEAIRAYPAAVAGKTTSFEFDRDALTGTLVYEATAGGITEIVVPTRLYPEGVEAVIDGVQGCTAHHVDAQRLAIAAETAGAVTVTFGPPGSQPTRRP